MKTVLIVVGVLFALLIVGTGVAVLVGLHVARHTRVEKDGDNVRVVSPFGTVETNSNHDDLVRELGTALYPGAKIEKGNTTSSDIAGVHTLTSQFDTADPASKVAAFYKKKFPDANVSAAGEGQYTIVSSANHTLFTINIQQDGSKTSIAITSVGGSQVTGGRSSD